MTLYEHTTPSLDAMPRDWSRQGITPEVRRRAVEEMLARKHSGRSAAEIAAEIGVADRTVLRWARIDRGYPADGGRLPGDTGHGTIAGGLKRKCRCQRCVAAVRAAKHGTHGLYGRGCRCDACRAAHNDSMREYMRRRKGRA